MAPSIPIRHHGPRGNTLLFELSQIIAKHPYSSAGKISQHLGIGKSAASKLQKSSTVGATEPITPCAMISCPTTLKIIPIIGSNGLANYTCSNLNGVQTGICSLTF